MQKARPTRVEIIALDLSEDRAPFQLYNFCKDKQVDLLVNNAEGALFMQLFRQREHAVSLGDCIQQVLGKRYAIRAKCSVKKQEISPADALIQKANSSQIETAVE